jgi:hypothetical protein
VNATAAAIHSAPAIHFGRDTRCGGQKKGPNPERSVFRSTNGGQTFDKVLYRDEYSTANDVRIDPSNPQIVYATLWQQQHFI